MYREMDAQSASTSRSATVVGAGLVGSLLSCFLARRGFDVNVFEMREDIRRQSNVRGKSINLALSERGLNALRRAGLQQEVIDELAIPMYARMIHDRNGKCWPIPYGQSKQSINSVSRRRLNEILLDEAEKYPQVKIHFQHRLLNARLENGECEFGIGPEVQEIQRHKANVLFGADGAHSAVRSIAIRQSRIDFSQQYIDHGYIELSIEPTANHEFAMKPNYLHIWPRGHFMMIALPNADRSFTLTLFMRFAMFDQIRNEQDLKEFFEQNFVDAIDLIGWVRLRDLFFSARPAPLVTVRCRPMHYRGQVLLIGDAAHAMVPFFGQGMNCGFEDCSVLDELLEQLGDDSSSFESVFSQYSDDRCVNCEHICRLAMENYIEMRDHVTSTSFLIRKKFDLWLNRWLGDTWMPLYSMVTFSLLPYRECVRRRANQDRIVKCLKIGTALALIFGLIGSQSQHIAKWIKST